MADKKRAGRSVQDRYRLLVESVTDYAIYMLDPQGTVTSWNAGAERFKGYTQQEILGEHFSRFYTEQDQASGLPLARSVSRPRRGASSRRGGASARTAR